MEYVIYSYGGGDLLISVFNAIAMLFKSDNTYLTPVGTMALTLGGVYAGIKATFKGDIALIGKSWMIPSMITFLILFSPKTTVWIKDEVALTAPVKVDHIPIGISFFTSVSSTIAHHLSKLLEETMLPVEIGGATTTGILYGAKAVAKVRDIQINDPILLRNTKEYLRQCYMKPYVMGNFGGHRAEAIRSTDLLTFLNANPAKCFGIKPTNKDGSIGTFMTCKEAGKMIKKEVTAESKTPLLMSQFGSALGISTSNDVLMAKRIKAMTSDVFKYLEQDQENVHEWMKQAMMLNANRESYDDWREKVGHPRVFPELVKMQATRGLFQQSMGSIVGGEMATALIPAAAQPTMLALVVMLFVIILPFALLPGGWMYIITGIKLMIWVCSWPIFYTIIHAIAMIQLKDSIGGWGEDGLSLVGQAGFTQLIMMKYATAQHLISATPLISFAIVFASPYALSSIAGGVASVASAMGIGSNMADGNLSMGQVSNNNKTIGQRNTAPTLLMGGGVIDDGAIRVQSDNSGQQIITEHQDQMAVNYNANEVFTGQSNIGLSNAKSEMASLSKRESEIASSVDGKTIDLANSIATGTASSSGISLADTEAIRNGFTTTDSTKSGTSVVDSQSTGTSSDIGIGVPKAFSAFTGISGGTRTNAANSHEIRKDMSAEELQQFNSAMERVKTAARNDSITTTNSEDTRLVQSLKSDLTKQDQIAQEKAITKQDIDTYTEQLSYLESNSGMINRNVNNQVMGAVMAKHPELQSKEQAARWMKSHRAEADNIAKDVIDNYNPFNSANNRSRVENIKQNTSAVQNTNIATPDSLETKHQENAKKVQEQAVVKDATNVEKPIRKVVDNAAKSSNLGYNEDVGKILQNNLNQEEQKIAKNLQNERVKGKDSKVRDITDFVDKGKEKFESITGKSSALRVIEDIGNTSTAVIDHVTNNKKDKQ